MARFVKLPFSNNIESQRKYKSLLSIKTYYMFSPWLSPYNWIIDHEQCELAYY